MRILLAVDGSQCSDAAVDQVAQQAWSPNSEIRVLTAYDLPLPATPEAWAMPVAYLEEMDRAASDHAHAVVDRAVKTLQSKFGDAVSGTALAGPARTVILDEAEQWKADLIVVGSHGYGAWKRFLIGSVSQSVAAHAKCSVEIVRCETHRQVAA